MLSGHSRETSQAQSGSTAFPWSTESANNFKQQKQTEALQSSCIFTAAQWLSKLLVTVGCVACQWKLMHFECRAFCHVVHSVNRTRHYLLLGLGLEVLKLESFPSHHIRGSYGLVYHFRQFVATKMSQIYFPKVVRGKKTCWRHVKQ